MPVEISRRRFTVDDYHRMVDAGILCENDRVELIDGEVVAMTPVGPRHNACVDRANKAFLIAVGDTAIIRTQGSVRLNDFTEPEPDIVLLRPRADFYGSAHPGPPDILLIVEIAESSLSYDVSVKARLYAETGVSEYWLADLGNGVLRCYADPAHDGYRKMREFHRGARVTPWLLPNVLLRVEDLIGE
jgi:Uma2 family endonuclease